MKYQAPKHGDWTVFAACVLIVIIEAAMVAAVGMLAQ